MPAENLSKASVALDNFIREQTDSVAPQDVDASNLNDVLTNVWDRPSCQVYNACNATEVEKNEELLSNLTEVIDSALNGLME
eukprot:997343-Ditylum_brightwellii.AAC.1